jgi:hypothetical protein
MNDEREYLATTRWTPAEWGRDRSGDWATAVRIGEPPKAVEREVIKPGLTTATGEML